MTHERRSLTFFESLFYLWRVGPVVASVTLEGRVDAEVLQRALGLLQRDHPLVRCSFRRAPDAVSIELADDGPVLELVAPGSNGLAQVLNTELQDDRRVYRVTLAQGPQSAVLSFAGDHAGSDARLNTLLLRRLLGHYTDLLRGVESEPTGRSAFEGSLEEALLAAYEPGPVQPPQGGEPPLTLHVAADAPGELAVRGFAFEPATTAALLAAARRDGVSLTNLLVGAMACAVRARFPEAGPLPVAPAFAVDLRSRVDPPIAADAPFCCVARLVCSTGVDVDDRPAEVGRRIGAQLKESLEQEEIQHRLVSQRAVGEATPLPPISFMVSNIGVIEEYPVPEGLRVTDSRWATTSRGPVPTLFGSTVEGRLTLDLVYDTAFHRTEVIEEVAKQFEAVLLAGVD
ncbi:phthiocerol/phthiodiolone dimycocerosyl transferase family protein [Kitasatospora sp. KL5]|uniref:phthiocerol/phthiodiolone dimycocerosyl transferase family protein n=1 Tax=Kitasatospora sp. KL5 TaxID=3425125 RepID=UPI003D6FFCD2